MLFSEFEQNELDISSFSLELFTRFNNESQAAYLSRSVELLCDILHTRLGLLADLNRLKEEDFTVDEIALIDEIVLQAQMQCDSSNANNELNLSLLSDLIAYHDRGELGSSMDFDTTQRSRMFFDIQYAKASAKRESYWNTLFFLFNTSSTRRLAKTMLDGKKILLFGGGRSKLNVELNNHNINPDFLLNVDPFVDNLEIDSDEVVSFSAADSKLPSVLNQKSVNQVDEIWAEFSVPAYLHETNKIKILFENIHALLAVGGNARIWPLKVSGVGESSICRARKQMLIESVRWICSQANYELNLFKSAGSWGMVLTKLDKFNVSFTSKEVSLKVKNISTSN